MTLYSRHHYYANAYTAIVAALFSEGFLEHACVCALAREGLWGMKLPYIMSVHAYTRVCTTYSLCLRMESDTSVSNTVQEIMEPTVNE